MATQHSAATDAAVSILRKGGTAADAAVAAAFTLGVVAPDCSGIGGGGFALAWSAHEHAAKFLDFRETAPRHVDPRRLEEALGRSHPQKPGQLVGTPGEVRGLFELQRRYGRLPLAEDMEPAIRAAENGYQVGESLARNAYALRTELAASERLGAMFAVPGPVLLGSILTNSALAATLRAIARSGPDAFYRGPIAEELVHSVSAAGGWLDLEDLADYSVIERQPIHMTWEGYEVLTAPPPSAGGLLLLETLKSISIQELRDLRFNSAPYIHELAELFRDALADRMQAVGDPQFDPFDIARLATDRRMARRKQTIRPFETHPLPSIALEEHGTSHLVTVDDEGNVVSLTTTIGDAFGSRVVAQRSGVILNDELVDFSSERQLRPFRGEVEFSSISKLSPNGPRPGARPVSSMTPVIVLSGGEPVLGLGGAGGLRIATGVTQALLGRLAFGRSAADAVSALRFHTPYEGPTVEVEFGTGDDVVQQLKRRKEMVDLYHNFSAVQMISIDPSNDGPERLVAAADPRFAGTAYSQ